MQAQALIEAGRAAEATQLLAHGLGADPQNYALLCLMAQAMMGLKRLGDAADYAEKAIASSPEQSWGHRLRSLALKGLQPQESWQSAKQAIELEPLEPYNWHVFAGSYLRCSDLKQARAAAERMRELAPANHLSHEILGLVALAEKKDVEAEAHFRKELQLNPTSYHGMNNLGVALLRQGRKKESVEVLNLAAKMNPVDALARRNLQVAVNKYVPGLGITGMVIYLAFYGLSASGSATGGGSGAIWAIIAILILFISAVVLVRKWMFKRLPNETRLYLKSLARRRRLVHLRSALEFVAVFCGCLFAIIAFLAFVTWGDGGRSSHLAWLIVSFSLAACSGASIYAARLLPKEAAV